MARTIQQMLAEANQTVPKIDPDEARRLMREEDALLVDVRGAEEIAQGGKVKGALAVPRGMLEFRADRDSKYHDAAFDGARPVIVYCASGGRAALAGKTLSEMGYDRVYNLGGFKDAVEGGMETEGA